MQRRTIAAALTGWCVALVFSLPVQAAPTRPNIFFIMADDLGNADLGYRGSGEIMTPNIDRLANAGVRLESFYGQQVCGPSRAALMTGRYPMRYGLQTLFATLRKLGTLPVTKVALLPLLAVGATELPFKEPLKVAKMLLLRRGTT